MRKVILVVVAVAVLFGVWQILKIPFVGWNYETTRGEHTGYVTSVEQTGLFFKTGRAYIKTDTQSSQEDMYCVMDSAVFDRLKSAAVNKTHVNVYYVSWIAWGVAKCDGENDAIVMVADLDK